MQTVSVQRVLSVASFLLVGCAGALAEAPLRDSDLGIGGSRKLADRFARLALDCIDREYPNKISHVMQSDDAAKPPRELHPVFYGCFDWHSSVHGHWLLVRLCRLHPTADFVPEIRQRLDEHFTAEKVAAELEYMKSEERATFERPYGLAWMLCLMTELREWREDEDAQRWLRALSPLEQIAAERFAEWLPKLSHPVRTGTHDQTAFAMGLVYDWAVAARNEDLQRLIAERTREFFGRDRRASLAFEPSGQDFLSPILAEADLVRRVQSPAAFAAWLGAFCPDLGAPDMIRDLHPEKVTDPTDGHLAHLDGLNLSRAWMLQGIASGLPHDDPRRPILLRSAKAHAEAGIASVTGDHYEGGHWLGSFAVYLATQRGLGVER